MLFVEKVIMSTTGEKKYIFHLMLFNVNKDFVFLTCFQILLVYAS